MQQGSRSLEIASIGGDDSQVVEGSGNARFVPNLTKHVESFFVKFFRMRVVTLGFRQEARAVKRRRSVGVEVIRAKGQRRFQRLASFVDVTSEPPESRQ